MADFELKDSDIPLFDSFASIAFQQLIAAHPPSRTAHGTTPCDWADDISKLAYYMATSMMVHRHEVIDDLYQVIEEVKNEG